MHIQVVDDTKMIIYLNKINNQKIDFNKKEDLQEYFKQLFFNLKAYYNININGFYDIDVYKDNNYGAILEINKEDLDYMEYFNGSVDMNIAIQNQTFLYEIEDYFSIDKNIYDKINLYKYKNKLYIEITQKLNDLDIGKITEFSKIKYDNETSIIVNSGKKINLKTVLIN